MVAKDQYGLEYPWRARTLINMMPKPLRKILKTQINQVMGVLQGILQGAAPGKILNWMKLQSVSILKITKEKIMILIKEKFSKPVSSKNDKNREKENRKASQLMQVNDDMENSSDDDLVIA